MNSLAQLFEELALEQDRLRAAAQHRQNVLERIFRAPPRSIRPGLLLVGCLTLTLVALSGWQRTTRSEPLAARIAGSYFTSGDVWLAVPQSRHLSLSFSDGTHAELAPGSEARLNSVSEHGPELEIRRERGSFSVTPIPNAPWRVKAGPFAVRVTGTRFDLTWDPAQDLLEVVLFDCQARR